MQVILFQKLEEKMKVRRALCSVASTYRSFQGTEMETAIPDLFVGHYSTYVECLNVPYTSSRRQSYIEIELDVSGCKDVYESLERFCAEEMLQGPYKYNTGKHGLQVRSQLFDCHASIEFCLVRMLDATYGLKASLLYCSCV